jgi:hypothetical protein
LVAILLYSLIKPPASCGVFSKLFILPGKLDPATYNPREPRADITNIVDFVYSSIQP